MRRVMVAAGAGVLLALVAFWLSRPDPEPPTEPTAAVAAAAPAPHPAPPGRAERVGPRHPPGHHARAKGPVAAASPEEAALPELSPREHVEAGEAAFAAEDAELGYRHFLAVIEDDPDHELAPFALYKLAWAEYNLGDIDAAVSDMTLVVEWLQGADGPVAAMIREDALEDLVTFRDERAHGDPITEGWP